MPSLPSSLPSVGVPGRRAWVWLVAGLLFGLVWCLGTRGLNEPDEGRYASMARAMVETGDWWEPRLSGYGHYDKPPLTYWATALSLKLFGFNEWAARLPSLFGAVCALAGLGWTAWRLHGPRVAWWALLICGTSVQFWVCARLITPDMLLTGWTTLAVGAWAECRERLKAEGRRQKAEGPSFGGDAVSETPPSSFCLLPSAFPWGWWALSLLFWTLGWWTKATPALVPLIGLAVGTWVAGDRAGRRALRLPLLLPAILVLGSPWYVSMLLHYPELKGFFFGKQLADRMAGSGVGRWAPFWYYLPISLVAWLPWWPLAAWFAWRGRRREPPGDEGWRGWARKLGPVGGILVVGLLILSLNASKLPTYTLTLAPWAALLLAQMCLVAARDENRMVWLRTVAPIALVPLAVIALSGALILPFALDLESRLGRNSSLRQHCDFLRWIGARVVYADRYWPGMEFYLESNGFELHYVVPNTPRQRAKDMARRPDLFLDPTTWRAHAADASRRERLIPSERGAVWLVQYAKEKRSPFQRVTAAFKLDASMLDLAFGGDFILVPATGYVEKTDTELPP